MEYNLELKGKVALVTGASRDIGREIVRTLAQNGVMVVINYLRNEEGAETTLKEVVKEGSKGILIKADVTKEDDVRLMVEKAVDSFGRIDILINNARATIVRKDFEIGTWEEYQGQIDVLLKGIYNCSREALEGMKLRGWGRIINIGSALLYNPVKGYTAYTSAIASVIGFTRNLAIEVGIKGITVNTVLPGFTLTERTPYAPKRVQEELAQKTPLRRLALPRDIAGAVLFFASDLSEFITGSHITVDGGFMLT